MALSAFIFICLSTFITYSWQNGYRGMFCQELNPSNPLMRPTKLVNIKSSRKHIWQGTYFVCFYFCHFFICLFVCHVFFEICYKANGRGIFASVKPWEYQICPNALILSIMCTLMWIGVCWR